MAAIFVRSVGDYRVVDATIAASAATSDVVDVGNHVQTLALCMPTSWTAATLAFKSSPTVDGTYIPIVGATGSEITVSATVDVCISLMGTNELLPFRYIKIISGSSASPVTQTEERVIQVLIK